MGIIEKEINKLTAVVQVLQQDDYSDAADSGVYESQSGVVVDTLNSLLDEAQTSVAILAQGVTNINASADAVRAEGSRCERGLQHLQVKDLRGRLSCLHA